MAESKIDPFDVAALEKSLNDSATRVSTSFVTFIVFASYLLTIVGNISHRQLLLQDTIKLPTLNIDLPPSPAIILLCYAFVAFHAYILVQIVLLARTAFVYNEASDLNVSLASDRERVRRRLTNDLFVQSFAGSPLDREGPVGVILRMFGWIVLGIGPVALLLAFQMSFLPYHSAVVTWVLRTLIAVDLAMVVLVWPVI